MCKVSQRSAYCARRYSESQRPKSLRVCWRKSTYQVPTRITISSVDPLALRDNLAHFSSALFCRPLVPSLEQLIGAVSRSGSRHWGKGQHGKRLAEFLLRELSPYLINALLWRLLRLLLLLLVFIVIWSCLWLWC